MCRSLAENTIKIWTTPCLLFLIFFFIFSPYPSTRGEGTVFAETTSLTDRGITIAAGADSPPIYYMNNKGEPKGWLVDIWKLWSKKTRIPIQFKMRSFGNSLKLMKTGEADVHAGCLYSDIRTDFLDYLQPLADIETHIFISENIYGVSSLTDIQGFRVGVIEGDFAVEFLKKSVPDISLAIYRNNQDLFDAVEAGHIKVFVKDKPIALYLLKKRGLIYHFKYDGTAPLYENKFYAAVPKGEGKGEIARRIRKGMAAISPREFMEIEQRWTGMAQKSEKNVLVISMPRFYEPFSMLSHDGRPTGLMVDLWQLWSEKTGYAVSFKFGQWEDSITFLKEGISDIHSGLFKNPQREQWMDFSHSLFPVASQLYFSEETTPISLEQLKEKKVGVLQGSYQENWLKENYPAIDSIPFSNTIDMLYSLIDQQIHAMLDESVKVEATLNNLKLTGDVHHAPDFTLMNPLCAAVLKENRALYQLVVDGLAQISKQELTELENRWILNPRLRLLSLGFQKFELTPKEKNWLGENQIFRLGVDPEFPPFEFFDSDGTYSGIASDYIRRINSKLDVQMNAVKGLSWSEILHETREGNIDILPCITKTPAREAYLNFTRPYISLPIVLVTRDDAPLISAIEDLSQGTIAVVKSYATHEHLVRDYPSQKLLVVESLEKGLLAVDKGDADAFLGNLASISYALKKLGMSGLNVAANTQYIRESSMGIRKDLPQLIPIFNKALDAIDARTKNDIQNRWNNIRFEERVNWGYIRNIIIVVIIFSGTILAVILLWNRRLAGEIAEHKQTQLRFHSMASHVPGAIFQAEITSDGRLHFKYISPRCHDFFGFTAQDVINDQKMFSIHRDDETPFRKSLQEAMGRERDWNFTGRLILSSTEVKWFEGMGKAIVNEPKNLGKNKNPARSTEKDGLLEKTYMMNGILIDITERKLAELKYIETEKRIRAMSQTSSDAMIMINADGVVQFWNQASENLFEISASHATGTLLSRLITIREESGEECRELFRIPENCETQSATLIEFAAASQTVEPFPIELSRTFFAVEGSRYALMTLRNISQRKTTELELRKLSRAIEHSPASVMITDIHGTIEYVNPAFVNITGYSSDEAIGKSPAMLSSGKHSGEFYKKLWKRILSCRVWEGEIINRRKNGEEFWEKNFIAPITNDEGEIIHFVAVKNDITESKNNEMLLQQQLKELERFNKMTIGRETKMIELKKEVNQLMQTLGKKAKYKIVQ